MQASKISPTGLMTPVEVSLWSTNNGFPPTSFDPSMASFTCSAVTAVPRRLLFITTGLPPQYFIMETIISEK